MNVIILGAGAIGSALARAILDTDPKAQCFVTYYRNPPNISHSRLHAFQLDALEEKSFSSFADEIKTKVGPIKWLINTIGILHDEDRHIFPEKRLADFDAAAFSHVTMSNILPTVYAAKYLGRLFDKKTISVFTSISAKVGSIEDNRLGGWYSYRSSKAGLNMMLKNIAIEFSYTNKNICVAALHPGTTASNLSAPFQKNVPPEKLFSPEFTAGKLLEIIKNLKPSTSAQYYSWDGSLLPW